MCVAGIPMYLPPRVRISALRSVTAMIALRTSTLSSGLIFGFIAMYRMLWLGATWNWLPLLLRYFCAMSGGGAA